MKKYRVVLALASGLKDVGRQCISLYAKSPFEAALEAEKLIDAYYGGHIYSHAKSVSEIPADSRQNLQAA